MKVPLIIVVVTALFATLAYLFWTGSQDKMELWGESFDVQYREADAIYLGFESSHGRIELSILSGIDAQVAAKLRKEKVIQFSSLFEKQRVGYKGQHTDHVQCQQGYKPEYFQEKSPNGDLVHISGFANDRYVPGACNSETATMAYQGVYLICDELGLFVEADLFSTTMNPDFNNQWTERMTCTGLKSFR